MALGYDEAGEGRILLLVHGFPMNRRIWSGQVTGLSNNRRVVAVDLRGRGKSPAESWDWTLEDHADDLAATIDSLGAVSADVAGISMGGYVLFEMWRRHPAKCRSLIFMSTRASSDTADGKQGRKNVAARVREKGSGELVDIMFPKVFGENPAEQVKDHVRRMFEEIPPETAAADSLAMGGRPDSTGDLAGISVPALVIHGDQDQLVPLEAARRMAGMIPGARFAPISGAGHFTAAERPRTVNGAVQSFLSGLAE